MEIFYFDIRRQGHMTKIYLSSDRPVGIPCYKLTHPKAEMIYLCQLRLVVESRIQQLLS
jgi:hypothetical protein